MSLDFVKDFVFFIHSLLYKEKYTFDKARLLNHTTLEILFKRDNTLYATIVTGDYKELYKQFSKDEIPRSIIDGTQALEMIRKYKSNWVVK